MLFEKVTIIGLGLIGSSVARDLRATQLAGTITGVDVSDETLDYCLSQHIIDRKEKNAATAVADADMVLVACPPDAFAETLATIAPHVKKSCVVTDVLSVKSAVLEAVAALPVAIEFIPAHPIAGSEKTGAAGGKAGLFTGRKTILTPAHPQETPALLKIRQMWEAFGASVEMMPADTHDMIYAYLSHLPQLIGFSSAALMQQDGGNPLLQRFLRLQGSSPLLWVSILLHNQPYVLKALQDYIQVVQQILKELAEGDTHTPVQTSVSAHPEMLTARIAASCLVTTVTLLEKQLGMKLARFAGSGFADIACPALEKPDSDIEAIAAHYREVAAPLTRFTDQLKSIYTALAHADYKQLTALLSC